MARLVGCGWVFFAKVGGHRLTRALSYSYVTFDGEYTKCNRGVPGDTTFRGNESNNTFAMLRARVVTGA